MHFLMACSHWESSLICLRTTLAVRFVSVPNSFFASQIRQRALQIMMIAELHPSLILTLAFCFSQTTQPHQYTYTSFPQGFHKDVHPFRLYIQPPIFYAYAHSLSSKFDSTKHLESKAPHRLSNSSYHLLVVMLSLRPSCIARSS